MNDLEYPNNDDRYLDLLISMPAHIQRWLRVDRNHVCEGVIQAVLWVFAALPSPDEREGVTTGLDFLSLIKTEGGDNALWQMGMDQLDSEVYSAVAALNDDHQVALLLPWVDDLDELATDCDADQWAGYLRRCDDEWRPVLRRLVMDRV